MFTLAARLVRFPLIAVLLAGCAASSTSSPSTSGASEVAVPSSAPSEATASSASCDPGVICSGLLAPGDYTSTSTGATITFTLTGSEWTGDADTPGRGFALFSEDPGGVAVITVAPWAGVVFSDACVPDQTTTIGTGPAELMGVLTALDGAQADSPADVTVGGLPALELNLTIDAPCADSGGRLWVFQSTGGDSFNFRGGTQARIYAIDAGSVTVVIAIEAVGDVDDEALLAKAEAIIATMTIEPAS
jgi:hypothetical protein